MSSANLVILEARLAEARRVLDDCNRRIKVARRAARRQRAREQPTYLTPHEQAVAVAVHVMSGHSASVAADYMRLKRCARRRWPGDGSPGSSRASTEDAAAIEDLYLSAPLDDITAVHFPSTEGQHRVAVKAKAFLAEAQAVTWVREQTCRKALPVRPSAVRHMYEASLRQGGCPGGSGAASERAGRRWCSRLRTRWGLRRRGLRPDEPAMTMKEMKDKARPPSSERRGVRGAWHAGFCPELLWQQSRLRCHMQLAGRAQGFVPNGPADLHWACKGP